MKDSLRQQFERLSLRLAELDATLADPSVASDMKRYREVSREHAEVSTLSELFARFVRREQELAAAQAMLDEPEMAELAQEEIGAARKELDRLQHELQSALLPQDPDDERNAFMEIRAGTGGEIFCIALWVYFELYDCLYKFLP